LDRQRRPARVIFPLPAEMGSDPVTFSYTITFMWTKIRPSMRVIHSQSCVSRRPPTARLRELDAVREYRALRDVLSRHLLRWYSSCGLRLRARTLESAFRRHVSAKFRRRRAADVLGGDLRKRCNANTCAWSLPRGTSDCHPQETLADAVGHTRSLGLEVTSVNPPDETGDPGAA